MTLNLSQSVKISKQLITYDGLKEIVKIQESQMTDLRMILAQKDTIIRSYERTVMNFEGIRAKDQVILQAEQQKYKDLNKKYIRAVRWGRFKVVLLPVVGAAGLYAGYKLFN